MHENSYYRPKKYERALSLTHSKITKELSHIGKFCKSIVLSNLHLRICNFFHLDKYNLSLKTTDISIVFLENFVTDNTYLETFIEIESK